MSGLFSVIPKRFIAFWALTLVYLGINLVYKLSGQSGKYSFSPSSALALAEFTKMLMSMYMISRSVSVPNLAGISLVVAKLKGIAAEIRRHFSRRFFMETAGLALLYCINNNTYFWIYLYADAASIQLIKSGSSFISAFIMWFFLKRLLSSNQWLAITLQVCGLITVQWDPCKSAPILHVSVYLALLLAVSLTSIASVWNERVVKTGAPLNVVNSMLYASGFIMQIIWFNLFTPADHSFFEGYGWMGVLVVLFNAFIGLAISAVYKYADVIVKLLSTTCVTGILMVLNTFLFEWKPNIVIVCGTIVVFGGTWLYMNEPKKSLSVPQKKEDEVEDV